MNIGFSTMNTPLDPTPMELARALEERSFESLWTGEHSHIPTSRLTPWPAGEELPRGRRSPKLALRSVLVLLHRTVLTSGAGKLQMRCAAPYRSAACQAISGCLSVMRERRSARSAFLVVSVESVENFEESLLLAEVEAFIDANLRLNVLYGLAVPAVQEGGCRSHARGGGCLRVLHHGL